MKNLKQFGLGLALVALMMLTALAQTPVAPDVNIMIQPRQVQFVAQKAIQEMRFQVFDEQGNLVYDTGALTEPELKWNLRNGNGGELAGGLYAYTLTIKEQGKEAAQEKRGHFIIERADEQKSNRLWITSQAATGVGADVQGGEVTVATSEQGTVAGARQASTTNAKAGAATQNAKTEKTNEKAAAGFNDASTGTLNRIAKWVATDKIGDSVIFEVNGKVGIGTSAPGSKLHVADSQTAITGENVASSTGIPSLAASIGVLGISGKKFGQGVVGRNTNSGTGVYGESAVNLIHGVTPAAETGTGVYGRSTNKGVGVLGESEKGVGVQAKSTSGTALIAGSTSGTAISASSEDNNGIVAYSKNDNAASVISVKGKGIEATSGEDNAVYGTTYSLSKAAMYGQASETHKTDEKAKGVEGRGRIGVYAYGAGVSLKDSAEFPTIRRGTALVAEAGLFADAANFIGDVAIDGELKTNSLVLTPGLSLSGQTISGVEKIAPRYWNANSLNDIQGGSLYLGNQYHGPSGSYSTTIWMQSSGSQHIALNPNSGFVGIRKIKPEHHLDVAGRVAAEAFVQTSDQRFKQNIRTLDNALDKVLALRGVSYDWKRAENPAMNFESGTQLGFIAQEVEKVLPEAVKKDSQGMYTMNYTAVVPVLVEAVKQQQQSFEGWQKSLAAAEQLLGAVRAENATLKEQNTALAARLEALEQTMTALTAAKTVVPPQK